MYTFLREDFFKWEQRTWIYGRSFAPNIEILWRETIFRVLVFSLLDRVGVKEGPLGISSHKNGNVSSVHFPTEKGKRSLKSVLVLWFLDLNGKFKVFIFSGRWICSSAEKFSCCVI